MSVQSNLDAQSMKDNFGANRETDRAELARRTYQQLRDRGLSDTEVMAFAGDLLGLVASEFRSQSAAE